MRVTEMMRKQTQRRGSAARVGWVGTYVAPYIGRCQGPQIVLEGSPLYLWRGSLQDDLTGGLLGGGAYVSRQVTGLGDAARRCGERICRNRGSLIVLHVKTEVLDFVQPAGQKPFDLPICTKTRDGLVVRAQCRVQPDAGSPGAPLPRR